jgi:hypothetical protein
MDLLTPGQQAAAFMALPFLALSIVYGIGLSLAFRPSRVKKERKHV